MLEDVVKYTPRPPTIVNIVSKFMAGKTTEDYYSLFWFVSVNPDFDLYSLKLAWYCTNPIGIKHTSKRTDSTFTYKKGLTFVSEVLGTTKFIAVHYRFDKSDWMKHCEDQGKQDNTSCNQVIDILNDIPKALNYFADYVENQMLMHDIGAVYMAAPPSEAEVKSGMEIILKERLGDHFKLLSAADLIPYIHQQ